MGDTIVLPILTTLPDATCFISYSSRSTHGWSCHYAYLLLSLLLLTCISIWPIPHFLLPNSLIIVSSIFDSITFQCLKSISIMEFSAGILHSWLITYQPSNLCDLIGAYNITLSSHIDERALLKTKFICAKPVNQWFSPALSTLKFAWKHLANCPSSETARHCYQQVSLGPCWKENASLRFSLPWHPTLANYGTLSTISLIVTGFSSTIIASAKFLSLMFATFFLENIFKLHTTLKSAKKNELYSHAWLLIAGSCHCWVICMSIISSKKDNNSNWARTKTIGKKIK